MTYLPGEIATVKRLFNVYGNSTFRYQYVRILKQVLFNRPAYRVRSAIPYSDETASGWVVDGVWLASPPVNVSVDEYNSIIDNDTVTLARPIGVFRFNSNRATWSERQVDVEREYVRNGSPFGRRGRINSVIHGLPPSEILSRENWTEGEKAKRDTWIRNNSIPVETNSVSMRMGDGEYDGSWCWSISVKKKDKEQKYDKAVRRTDEERVEAQGADIDSNKGGDALEVPRLQVLQAFLGISQVEHEDPERACQQMQEVQERERSLGEGQRQAAGTGVRIQGEDEEGEPGEIPLHEQGENASVPGGEDWEAEEADFLPDVREEGETY